MEVEGLLSQILSRTGQGTARARVATPGTIREELERVATGWGKGAREKDRRLREIASRALALEKALSAEPSGFPLTLGWLSIVGLKHEEFLLGLRILGRRVDKSAGRGRPRDFVREGLDGNVLRILEEHGIRQTRAGERVARILELVEAAAFGKPVPAAQRRVRDAEVGEASTTAAVARLRRAAHKRRAR